MRKRWTGLCVGLMLPGLCLGADVVRYAAPRAVLHGAETAKVTFVATEQGKMQARVGCDGQKWERNLSLTPGGSVELVLDGLAEGTHSCEGKLSLALADGRTGELSFTFPLASLPALTWTTEGADVSLAAKTLVTRASRPLGKALLTVLGPQGMVLDTVPADLSDPMRPSFSWSAPGEAVKLVVDAEDLNSFSGKLELTPWQYAIPHTDVIFASGSASLDASESPKLASCAEDVSKVIAKYGDVVAMELYVAGYTDTVGAGSANQALSERRAKAIASWFRAAGFTRPIWYQGFGEAVLAVPTEDEVSEAANRRALYVLAAAPPHDPLNLPSGDWKKL